jgi:hypothetical protein
MQRPQGSQAQKSVEQEAKTLVSQTELWEIRAVPRPGNYRFPATTGHRTGNSTARLRRALILTPMLGRER